ncbi:tape measure protein [Sphingobacterium spiritivorum]|uniref:tape measure protein n=1 Tax=Sphingobacterium spiritivorum TaxID=258 RepID=UPI003DA2BD1D
MSFIATLEVRISQFIQGLDRAQARMDQFAATVGKRMAEVGSTMESVGKKMSLTVTTPITALGVAAIKTYGDIEALRMGLISVMGSASDASKEFDKLLEVAKLPGLGLQEAIQGSVSLQAAGFSADEARKSLMAFGNALATVGKGAKELSLVNLALTQLQNKSSGFGQDLRQLTEQLPQLRGAMEQAFGTSDSETISKMGYTGAQVVKMLTAEFEKLPKVTGGIKNAFENMSDAITLSLSKIGDIINKNFKIEELVNKAADFLEKLITEFESLDPSIQKMILRVAGLAAAIGPLLVALGAVLQLAPYIGTAFTVMTGPIGIAIAAVAAAVFLIIKYWDDLKRYFTRGAGAKMWEDISASAKDLAVNLKNAWNEIYKLAVLIWGKIGTNILSVLQTTFDTIGTIINTTITYISKTIEGFVALLKGDFLGAFKAFGEANKAIFQGLFRVIGNTFKSLGLQMSAFYKLIGATKLGNLMEEWANKINVPVEGAKAHLSDLSNILDVELPKKRKKIDTKPIVDLGDDADKAAEKQRKLNAELDAFILAGRDQAALDTILETINVKYQEIYATIKQINNVDPFKLMLVRGLEFSQKIGAVIDDVKAKFGSINKENLEIKYTGNDLITIPRVDPRAFDERSKKDISNIGKNAKKEADKISEEIKKKFGDTLRNGITDMISNTFSAIGEAIGSGGNILGAVGNAIISTLGGLAKQIGEQLIAFGTAGLALKFMIKNPYLAIAAGAALIALGGIATSSVNKTLNSTGGYQAGYGSMSQSETTAPFRGSLYNNDRQVVEFVVQGDSLRGWQKQSNERGQRLT